MLTTVLITVFGADRPGLVEALAAPVTENGGNWLESRLLHLGGHFAGIVRVEIDERQRDALLRSLGALEREGLSVVAHPFGAEAATARATTPGGRSATIELVGHDRPGIVREISRALAARGVNVEELMTERTDAPMTGELLFKARADILLPPGVEPAALRSDLEKIASDLMIDLSFSTGGGSER